MDFFVAGQQNIAALRQLYFAKAKLYFASQAPQSYIAALGAAVILLRFRAAVIFRLREVFCCARLIERLFYYSELLSAQLIVCEKYSQMAIQGK